MRWLPPSCEPQRLCAQGVIAHLTSALDFGPTIIYNVPGRTGQDISVETMLQIADHPNFAGVKECMGRERIQAYSDRNIITWSGNDDECHETRHEAGCNGVISVTANLIPGLFSQMMKEPSYDVASDVAGLVDWLFVEPNPIGVNTLMMQLGLCQPVFRLPYVQYDEEMRAKGKALIEAIGLENVPGNKGCELMADGDFLHCADF